MVTIKIKTARVDEIFVTMMTENKTFTTAATSGSATTAAAVGTTACRLLALLKEVETAVPVVVLRDKIR